VFLGDTFSSGEEQVNVSLAFNETSETVSFEQAIVTLPLYDLEPPELETDDPLEYEVLGTSRRSDRVIQAGLSVLPETLRETGLPLASAHLMSGRKASELLLDETT
jgi:hypothetical protein